MSYTTRLLTDRLERAMPRRHQLVLLAVVAWVAAGALAASLTRPRETPAPMPAILIVATPTAHPIAGRAAPPERQEAPSATAVPPTEEPIAVATAEPQVITVYRYVEVQAPAPRQEEAPQPQEEPTAPPEPGDDNFAASFQNPPACNPFLGYLPGSPCYRPKP